MFLYIVYGKTVLIARSFVAMLRMLIMIFFRHPPLPSPPLLIALSNIWLLVLVLDLFVVISTDDPDH